MVTRERDGVSRRRHSPLTIHHSPFTTLRSSLGRGLERPRHFFGAVVLDAVADLDVVEVLDADAALEAFADLAHVVLEATQRVDRPLEDLDPVADDANPCVAANEPAPHRAPGDEPDLRHLEGFEDLGFAEDDLALLGSEHALEREPYVGDRLVDD